MRCARVACSRAVALAVSVMRRVMLGRTSSVPVSPVPGAGHVLR